MRPLSRRSRQLPSRGGDPSVSGADSSPWQGSQWRWLAVLFSLPPLLRGGGAGAQRMARWGRVSFNNSGSDPSVGAADSSPWQGSRPLSRQPLRFASEPPPLDRGGNPSGSQVNLLPLQGRQWRFPWQGEPTTQSMRLFTAASIYSHTPRKFLFTSLFGMRRTVKP